MTKRVQQAQVKAFERTLKQCGRIMANVYTLDSVIWFFVVTADIAADEYLA